MLTSNSSHPSCVFACKPHTSNQQRKMVHVVEDLIATGSSIKSACALMSIEWHFSTGGREALNGPVTGAMSVSGKTIMVGEIPFSSNQRHLESFLYTMR